MNSPSSFAAIQAIQEEQREGWMTDHQQQIADLNQRLIERQESFTAQIVRIENTWREKLLTERAEKDAKIAEQAAQIVALMDVCNVAYKTPRGESLSDHALECLEQALSTPAPPCVLMEDVTPLLDALKIIAANPGASHGPNFLYDSGPISIGAIAKFNAKHPQP